MFLCFGFDGQDATMGQLKQQLCILKSLCMGGVVRVIGNPEDNLVDVVFPDKLPDFLNKITTPAVRVNVQSGRRPCLGNLGFDDLPDGCLQRRILRFRLFAEIGGFSGRSNRRILHKKEEETASVTLAEFQGEANGRQSGSRQFFDGYQKTRHIIS